MHPVFRRPECLKVFKRLQKHLRDFLRSVSSVVYKVFVVKLLHLCILFRHYDKVIFLYIDYKLTVLTVENKNDLYI